MSNLYPLKNKIYTIFIFAMLFSSFLRAQNNVGIGTLTPNPKAILELIGTDQGFLVPRMDSIGRVKIYPNQSVNPTGQGMLVYDTLDQNFWYFDGYDWIRAIGPMGPQGIPGLDGKDGKDGVDGAAGKDGIQGPAGINGVDGFVGPTGPTGPTNVDSLIVTYASFDTVTATIAWFDSLFVTMATFDSVFATIAQFDSVFATLAQFDTLYSNIAYFDSLYAQFLSVDSLLIGGVNINTLIDSMITAAGTIGPTGITGTSGSNGAKGVTGATGPSGADGASGAKGATGASGVQGNTGATGATGADGIDGGSGSKGATGITGATGPSGADGASGAKGVTGATGASGVQGNAGATGSSGAKGATGADGASGAKGATGVTGASGSSGSNGAAGVAGATGATGADGAKNAWALTGNSGTTAGTNFLGTTDAVDFILKTSNTERLRVLAGGNIGVGTSSPNTTVHINNGSTGYDPFRVQVSGSTKFKVNNDESVVIGVNSSSGPQNGLYVYGNTGLGISAPSGKLHIVGDFYNQEVDYVESSYLTSYNPYILSPSNTIVTHGSGSDSYSAVFINGEIDFYKTGTSTYVILRLERDGTDICEVSAYSEEGKDQTLQIQWVDEPSVGSHTYKLKVYYPSGGMTYYATQLQCLEIKR